MAHSPFARLFQSSKPVAAKTKAEGDDDKKKLDEAETRKTKGTKAEADMADGDEEVEEVLDDATDDAEDEVADPDADPDEDDAEKVADAKKAKAAKAKKTAAKDGDEDDDEDGDDKSDRKDEKDAKASAARARERGRIAAIMRSDVAAKFPLAAMELALGGTQSRRSAIATLRAMSAAADASAPPPADTRREAARTRLAGTDVPEVGNGDGSAGKPTGDAAVAARIIAADKKRRGLT